MPHGTTLSKMPIRLHQTEGEVYTGLIPFPVGQLRVFLLRLRYPTLLEKYTELLFNIFPPIWNSMNAGNSSHE